MNTNTIAAKPWVGVGVALATPFGNGGISIDEQSFSRLLHHTGPRVQNWVVAGTTGESATLQPVEKERLVQLAVAAQKNFPDVAIILGLGGNQTAALVEEIKQTSFEGISALLSISPYYNKPTTAGVVAHYEALANASPVPIILYNAPGRTGAPITVEAVRVLAQHPNIGALKEAGGDVVDFIRKMAAADGQLDMLAGDDALTPALMSQGAAGVIGVLPNVLPALFGQMVALASHGDYAQSAALLRRLMPLNDLLYLEGNPVGIKTALNHAGICAAHVRLPLVEASGGLSRAIAKALDNID